MKLKHIAAAVALVATGAANAASFTNDTNNLYNNDMMANIWTATGSYAVDLGISFASFASAAAAGTAQSFNLSSDSLFTSFINGKSTYSWNILGTNDLTTFDVIATTTAAIASKTSPTDTTLGNFTTNMDAYAGALNGAIVGGAPLNVVAGTNSVVSNAGTDTYAANTANSSGAAGSGYGVGFATAASQANNSLANGISMVDLSVDPSIGGHSAVVNYGVKAYISDVAGVYSLNVAHVAAVPEPESLAMLLAGLGMIGSIVLRRSRKV